jgi:hypothetical protein
MQIVMPTEVGQLWVDLRIKPVGLEHRRLHIVEVEKERTTPKAAQPIFLNSAENRRLNWKISTKVFQSCVDRFTSKQQTNQPQDENPLALPLRFDIPTARSGSAAGLALFPDKRFCHW